MLDIILWSAVALAIIVFFVIIITGHSTNFRFLSDVADNQTLLATHIQNIGN